MMERSPLGALPLAVAVSLALSPSAWAQDEAQRQLEEHNARLDALESELDVLRESDTDSFDDLFGTVDIHGFLAQGFMISSANNYLGNSSEGSWEFNELGINFSTEIDERTRAGIQLFSRDLGPFGNNRIEVDWALMEYHWVDQLGLRFGKIRGPHGLYNETRDLDFLRNSILLPQSVYNEPLREALRGLWGVGIYGGFVGGSLGNLEYQLQVGTNDVYDDGAIAWTIEDGIPIDVTKVQMDTTWAGGLRWDTPLEGLLLSITSILTDLQADGALTQDLGPLVAGTPATYTLNDGHYTVLSAEFTHHDLLVAAEYWEGSFDTELDATPGPGMVVPVAARPWNNLGYYVSAAYRFTDWFELGSYYSVYYPDADDKDGAEEESMGRAAIKAWSKDLALTTRFDINDNWVFKLEGHYIDGVAGLFDRQNPDGYEQYWTLFLAKLSVSF